MFRRKYWVCTNSLSYRRHLGKLLYLCRELVIIQIPRYQPTLQAGLSKHSSLSLLCQLFSAHHPHKYLGERKDELEDFSFNTIIQLIRLIIHINILPQYCICYV